MTVLARLLQPVWEVSSEPIVVTGNEPDPNDRKILYVNQAFTQVNGYTKEEAIGRPLKLVHGVGRIRTPCERARSSFDRGGRRSTRSCTIGKMARTTNA